VHGRRPDLTEDERVKLLENASVLDFCFGHYFDAVIVNENLDRTYTNLDGLIQAAGKEKYWGSLPVLA
jgi:guanylate kinase